MVGYFASLAFQTHRTEECERRDVLEVDSSGLESTGDAPIDPACQTPNLTRARRLREGGEGEMHRGSRKRYRVATPRPRMGLRASGDFSPPRAAHNGSSMGQLDNGTGGFPVQTDTPNSRTSSASAGPQVLTTAAAEVDQIVNNQVSHLRRALGISASGSSSTKV